jgi:hypothetical protein
VLTVSSIRYRIPYSRKKGCGSGFGIRIRIQEGKSDPQKQKKVQPSALKREHPTLHIMKFLNFFQFLWIILALLNPDPDFESGPHPFT